MNAREDADLRRTLEMTDLGALATPLLERAEHVRQTNPHGDREKWQRIVEQLADITPSSFDFTQSVIRIGAPNDCDRECKARIKDLLLQLQPWRKGPFDLFGIRIDSEWRSNLKWQRLAKKITSMKDRRVLDVGCGNGYYLWRMIGQGARLALGIDPTQLYLAQFNALKKYCRTAPAFILPLKSNQFPNCNGTAAFDSVFSMGVLSHRRDPHAHLRELHAFTRPGGELVIETLVVDGDASRVLKPAGRYAKMRNVHAIPSPPALEKWLQAAGWNEIRLLDISKTTTDEQRVTEWMAFESLADFLAPTDDPANPSKTIEDHPAPQRAIFVCNRRE